jgi:hypothetical protein
MYVYEEYDYSMFEARFRDYKRLDQFSPEALRTLFTELEQLAQETGEPIEIDVIALCCEWNESTMEEIMNNYDVENYEDLLHQTLAIELENGAILYQVF